MIMVVDSAVYVRFVIILIYRSFNILVKIKRLIKKNLYIINLLDISLLRFNII